MSLSTNDKMFVVLVSFLNVKTSQYKKKSKGLHLFRFNVF